jgi:hypothetical protein
MQRGVLIAIAIGLGLGGVFALGGALEAHGAKNVLPASTRPSAFVRGVGLGLFASDPNWDYGPMVEEIRSRGATDVLIVVNAYQSNRFASDIALPPSRSPSEATLARTMTQVRDAGMRAALMPVVRLDRRAPHEWRGLIAPADGLDAWFSAYRKLVLRLAELGQAQGAIRFVVGSELSSLERYEQRWRMLIDDVRARFEGRLTYSANWDHASEVPFWDALDEVGLTAYFPLGKDASSAGLANAWRLPRREIEALAARTAKPILITEIGYPSQQRAVERPWDDVLHAELDLGVQQRLYRGFCEAFSRTPSISGFYVWNWFGFGGPRDPGFTPRGKPAAKELTNCFARDWPARASLGNRL